MKLLCVHFNIKLLAQTIKHTYACISLKPNICVYFFNQIHEDFFYLEDFTLYCILRNTFNLSLQFRDNDNNNNNNGKKK